MDKKLIVFVAISIIVSVVIIAIAISHPISVDPTKPFDLPVGAITW